MSGNLFVISGPSGSGKTTLVSRVLAGVNNLRFSVSYTTRPMRGGEISGKHYEFVSREEFERMIDQDFFAEWARVHGNFYGTPQAQIEDWRNIGNDVILDIDVEGAKRLRKVFDDAIFIFVVPPSADILERRLRKRKSERDEDVSVRLGIVKREVECSKFYDYIVINDKIDVAANRIKSIILSQRGDCEEYFRKDALAEVRAVRRENVYDSSFLKKFGIE